MQNRRSFVASTVAAAAALSAHHGFAQTPSASPMGSPAASPAAYDPANDLNLKFPTTPGNYDKTDWPEKFTVGFFGGEDAEKVLSKNKPWAEYLSQWLGMPVENTTGTSYNAVIEAARANRIDAYLVGPFAYILGVQEANAEALAINVSSRADNPVYDHTIRPFYYSVISTWKGSGVQTIKDLPGHSFSFVDPASTSGHLVPESELIKNGINPQEQMKPIYAGSHPSSGLAIANKKVDAGATTEDTVANMAEEKVADVAFWADGQTNKERSQADFDALFAECPDGAMVPIFYSYPIPETPFAINKDMPASFKQAVKDALLASPQNADLIGETSMWFVDPTLTDPAFMNVKPLDAMYDKLREAAKLLNLDLKKL